MKPVRFGAALLICASAMVCVTRASKGPMSDNLSPSKQKVRIILQCRTPTVKAGGDVVLWLVIFNADPDPLWIDARMGWPGNLFLWAKWPGCSRESSVETFRPMITRPDKSDLVRIEPKCFYGCEMVIGRHGNDLLIDALKKLRRGRYMFRVIYYSPDVPNLGVEGFEMESNTVDVVVN